MPKVSVITINYNNVLGLEQTLKSVVQQTSNDFEYLVIDGASNDGSKEVIEKYQDKINYWISEPDKGIYNAMNKGIKIAQGDYCVFLNSGDYFVNKQVLSKMIEKLDGTSCVYGNLIKLFPGGRLQREKNFPENSLFAFYKGSLNHSSAFIKRTLFDRYGIYDENLKIVSDWKFFLIAFGKNSEKMNYVDVDICYFDMTGISNSNKKLEQSERRKVLEKELDENVLNDYDAYSSDIQMMQRIRKSRVVCTIVFCLERLLFKFEKVRNKRR